MPLTALDQSIRETNDKIQKKRGSITQMTDRLNTENNFIFQNAETVKKQKESKMG